MRFSLFVHMERWDDQVSHRQLFENLSELTLMAEAGGFGTVWIGEHHSMEYTVSPSPMPLLAYLAGKTTTIRLGAGTIIAADWDFDGTGAFPFQHAEVDGSASSVKLSTTHTFDRPGEYFVTGRVHSHRNGDVKAVACRIPNVAQARVVVG